MMTRPQRVIGLKRPVALSAGDRHTCAQEEGGELFCWGDNRRVQIAVGPQVVNTPMQVRSAGRVTAIATGHEHTCALREGKTLLCWGSNDQGQLGDTTTIARARPVRAGIAGRITQIAAGGDQSCAIANDTLVCWGARSGEPSEPVEPMWLYAAVVEPVLQ